jgi:hypothetical protein
LIFAIVRTRNVSGWRSDLAEHTWYVSGNIEIQRFSPDGHCHGGMELRGTPISLHFELEEGDKNSK